MSDIKNQKTPEVALSVKNLAITFSTDHGRVHAVRGVSFDLYKGETLCIVGESGSGKSVTSKAIMGILPGNGRIDSGEIIYDGEDLTKIAEEDFHRIRGHRIGMIFQDPLSSLNPIMRIGKQITEAMLINGSKTRELFNNLISNELMKCKNHEQEYNSKKADLLVAKKEAQSKKDKAALEEIASKMKSLNYSYKKTHKDDVAALKEVKKDAKKKVKAFKEEKLAIHKEKAIPLYKRLFKEGTKGFHYNWAAIIACRREYVDSLMLTRAKAKEQALKVMAEVGIPNPERRFSQYPFEFSGGMRQRIVIAIALTANPEILICDEPTTALDVTIQAQILELINRIKAARHMSVIFITHDLGVVANMADRVAVMYAGKIVEYGTANDIFYDPRHPYTWALLSSIPDLDSKEKLEAIPGTPPDMVYPPKGDAFALRSKYALGIDFKEEPAMMKISATHYAATWLLDPRAPKATMPKIVSTRIANSLRKAGIKDVKDL